MVQEKDHKFYQEIWKERPHICVVSGDYLGKEPLTAYFHHLLPKEENKFPEHRYDKWNIVIVSPFVHGQIENGVNIPLVIQKLYLEALERHRTFVENQEETVM